ncbi:MAG TPA: methyltransferase domain-containing protein [Acidimicrobiia bacterium]|nr:methyltransferase domain-containing protein [Acidimicrobiia bacterium]
MSFVNAYEDEIRAQAYATLEFPGTYYLAFRDLPALLAEHVRGRTALDFGCGAGRSTRFLRSLGFDTIGIDISPAMLDLARAADPDGRYVLVDDGDYRPLAPERFDLILSAFAFDNIPGAEHRADILRGLRRLLRPDGRIVLVDCTPEIYVNETASFTVRDFPENRTAKSGDEVRAVMNDVDDRRPVTDILWLHEDYLALFAAGDFDLVAHHSPVGRDDEPYDWITETTIPPWVIYILKPA